MAGVVHTKLIQINVSDLREAPEIFGKKRPDGTLPLVLTPTINPLRFWIMIPDGVYTIVHRFGKDVTDQFNPGLHLLPPWYKVVFLVSKQSCAYNAPIKNCPTKDDVMCGIDLTLVFRIVDPKKFVYGLGAIKFDILLKAATEDAIRGMAREVTHDKVFGLRGSKAQEFLKDLNNMFQPYGISFLDSTITNVTLPPDLADALQNETTFEIKQNEQKKKQDFDAKVINDKADLALRQLNAENERLAADEIAKKERILIKKDQSEIEAQKEKQLAIIKAEQEVSVRIYGANADLQNSKIQAEKNAALIVMKAKGELQAAKIKVDQEVATQIKQSEAALAAATNLANAITVESESEAAAAEKLALRRQHDLEVARLQALQSLAKSSKMLVGGDTGDYLIKTIVSSAVK